jgi:phosphatidylethanolamine-binding protein (PEBP) family uncharacterized protein
LDWRSPRNQFTGCAYYWVAYNLPADKKFLPANSNAQMSRNDEGMNSWQEKNYHAFCLSGNTHAVAITLYALDKRFGVHEKMSGALLEEKIKGHVLAKAALIEK